MRLPNLIVATLFTFLFVGLASADNQKGLRASFNGSSDLPDAIAFASFLDMIDVDDEHTFELVASALDMPYNDETRAQVQQRTALFKNAHKSLRDEDDRASNAILCSYARESRTTEETYAALNAVDDTRGSIREKHYLITISALSIKEQKAFKEFLNELKAGISYTKIDSQVIYEGTAIDVNQKVAQRCYENATLNY